MRPLSLLTAGPWTNRANTWVSQNGGDDIDEIDDLDDINEIDDLDDINEIDDLHDINENDDLDKQLEAGYHHGDVEKHAGEVPERGREVSGY